jgi:hypothetical protein
MPSFAQILKVHFSVIEFMELCHVLPKSWGCVFFSFCQNYEVVPTFSKIMEILNSTKIIKVFLNFWQNHGMVF